MNIFVSGINYKTTSIDVREKLSFTKEKQIEVLKKIIDIHEVAGCIILSTCNRTEVYVSSECSCFDGEKIEKLLCEAKGFDLYNFKKFFYFYSSKKAVEHILKVSCGLDSQILGEDQILSQVKDAHFLSMENQSSNDVLNTLFRQSITCAKRIKTFTDLSKNSVSAGSLSVKLIKNFFNGKMTDKCALIIGTGEIGAISLKHLINTGIGKVYISNRTHGKSESLSKSGENIFPIEYSNRYQVINECDIIISATNSPHYTITKDMLENSIFNKKDRIIIDLAVPRDVDHAVDEIFGIKYFNMDHLKITVDKNIDERLLEISKAEKIIEEFVVEYQRWYELRSVFPVIRDVQKYVEELVNERLGQGFSKLKSCDQGDKEIIQASVVGIVNEIMKKFVYSVKECGNMDDVDTYFRCLNSVIKDDWEN